MAEITSEFLEGLLAEGIDQDTIFTRIAEKTQKGLLNAISVYKSFMRDTGRVLTTAQKRTVIVNAVANAEKDSDNIFVDVNKVVLEIVMELNISKAAALSGIKRAIADTEVNLAPRSNVGGEVCTWLIEHPNAARSEFVTWMVETGRKESTANAYWSQFTFAKKCYSVWSVA